MNEEKVCFIIGPIGEEDSDTRERSDDLLDFIIAPVLDESGYKPVRADNIGEPGIITTQIVEHIVESPLLIADLTDLNPNVFYELAIRHAVNTPCIHMMKSGAGPPFDIGGMRTIPYDIDVRSADEAKKELRKQVQKIQKGNYMPNNPIVSARVYQSIKEGLGSIQPAKQKDISEFIVNSIEGLDRKISTLAEEVRRSRNVEMPYRKRGIEGAGDLLMLLERDKIREGAFEKRLKDLKAQYDVLKKDGAKQAELDAVQSRIEHVENALDATRRSKHDIMAYF